jgi:hypothetical protein
MAKDSNVPASYASCKHHMGKDTGTVKQTRSMQHLSLMFLQAVLKPRTGTRYA